MCKLQYVSLLLSEGLKKQSISQKNELAYVFIRDFQYLCTDILNFMKESDIIEVVSDASTETVLFGEMPVKTNLRITHSEPGIKGDTATNTLKPATLETGVEIRVPLFVNEGDLVQVDTRDGSYLQRVKE